MRDIRGGALDVIGGMRVLFGVCGTDHYCLGYAGRTTIVWGMRDGPPPRNRPRPAAVFGPAPPNPRRAGNRNGND